MSDLDSGKGINIDGIPPLLTIGGKESDCQEEISNNLPEEAEQRTIIYNTNADLYDQQWIIHSFGEDGNVSIYTAPEDEIAHSLKGLMFGDFRNYEDIGVNYNLSFFIDKMPHGIVDKQIPGIGATTLEILSARDSIIVFPTKILAYSKHKKHPQSLYVGSAIDELPTTTQEIIKEYLSNKEIEHKKLLVVADSMAKVFGSIPKNELNNYFYMVDEIDLLQADSNYRPQLESVMDYYFLFSPKKRCLVSATINDFSNPLLKNECRFQFTWNYNSKRNINLIHTPNINATIAEQIQKHKEDKIFIAYNSILNILNVISCLEEEDKKECAILCSEASKLEAGNYFQKLTPNNELPKRINFATCCYFTGVDIEDSYHLITASNAKRSYQALSSNRMEQIYGRCRVMRGVKSDTIIFSSRANSWGHNIIYGYGELLIKKAKKVITLLNDADNIIKDSPELIPFFKIMKEQIRELTTEKPSGEEPLNLIRTNIHGVIVPAYLNIDYLVEKQKVLFSYNLAAEQFADTLRKRHNVSLIEDNSAISKEQQAIESENQSEQNLIFDSYIEDAIVEIRELDMKGLLSDDKLDKKIRQSKRNKKLFYQRFKRLYKYADLESILEILYNSRAKDNKAFKNINNTVMFWAMEDEHPFKVSIRATFKQGEQYSATQIHELLTPIVYYHLFKTLRPRKYISLFNSFFSTKRPRSKYHIISENPLALKAQKERIKRHENNLLAYFIL